MKNLKKIVAVLLSMTAIASTTAFAATEATYKDGTASLVLADGDIVPGGEQLTVVIAPKDAELNSGNIYYINQGAFGEEFAAILADMKVKDGFGEAKNYEVRIGGVLKDGSYGVETFDFKEVVSILYGDIFEDGKVNNKDLTYFQRNRAGWTGYEDSTLNMAAADIFDDDKINNKDLTFFQRHRAGWTGYETIPMK